MAGTRRISSAHVLAFIALVLAAGGGYATAQGVLEPQPTVGYQSVNAKERLIEADGADLVDQLVFPTGTPLAVNAKLDVRKGVGGKFALGDVKCFLEPVGRRDRSVVTVAPGSAETLTLQSMGSFGTAPGTNAIDLFCRSSAGPYFVSDVRIAAISLDEITELTP